MMMRNTLRREEAKKIAKTAFEMFEKGAYEEAFELYKKSIEIDYLSIVPHVNVGMIHLAQKDYSEALQSFRVADQNTAFTSDRFDSDYLDIPAYVKFLEKLPASIFTLSHYFNERPKFFTDYGINLISKTATELWNDHRYDEALDCYKALVRQHAIDERYKRDINPFEMTYVKCLKDYADITIQQCFSDPNFKKDKKEVLFNKVTASSPYIKLYLLRQLQNINSQIGKIIWEQRGIREPSYASGTLAKINDEIKRIESRLNNGNGTSDQALKVDPMNDASYVRHHTWFSESWQYEISLDGYEKAIYLEPTHYPWYLKRCDLRLKMIRERKFPSDIQTQYELALADIQKVNELNYYLNKEYYEIQVDILKKLGRNEELAILIKSFNILCMISNNGIAKDGKNKQFIFKEIKRLAPSEQLILFNEALNPKTLLGSFIWIDVDSESAAEDKMIQRISREIAKLMPGPVGAKKKSGFVSSLFAKTEIPVATVSDSIQADVDNLNVGFSQMELMEGSESDEDSNDNTKPKKKSSWNFLGKSENKPSEPVIKVLPTSMQYTRSTNEDL